MDFIKILWNLPKIIKGYKIFKDKVQWVPMTDEEAKLILKFRISEKPSSKQIIDNYERLVLSNNPSIGGSFYLQSKIFFAKEHLMKGFPMSANKTKYDEYYTFEESDIPDHIKNKLEKELEHSKQTSEEAKQNNSIEGTIAERNEQITQNFSTKSDEEGEKK